MTVGRNSVGIIGMKIRKRNGDDDIPHFCKHQLCIVSIFDVFLHTLHHHRQKIPAGIIPILSFRENEGVDIFTGEKFRFHNKSQRVTVI